MLGIRGLGYVGLTTARLGEWAAFARDVLGAAIVDETDERFRLRLDDHLHRISVRAADEEAIDFIGWELADERSFDAAVAHLRESAIDAEVVTGERAARERGVSAYVAFRDPAGLPVELFHGAHLHGEAVVNRHGARFVTGALGIGHVFVMIDEFEATKAFYERIGFRLSDRAAGGDFMLYRCNRREHSLGIGDLAGPIAAGHGLPRGLQHLMLQVDDMDAVGRAYDACLDGAAPLATTLGRHSNDRMFSFYVRTPSGFDMEYGFGGIEVDDEAWIAGELTVESLWGHRPVPAPVVADAVA